MIVIQNEEYTESQPKFKWELNRYLGTNTLILNARNPSSMGDIIDDTTEAANSPVCIKTVRLGIKYLKSLRIKPAKRPSLTRSPRPIPW